jgi:hypothetical protein
LYCSFRSANVGNRKGSWIVSFDSRVVLLGILIRLFCLGTATRLGQLVLLILLVGVVHAWNSVNPIIYLSTATEMDLNGKTSFPFFDSLM